MDSGATVDGAAHALTCSWSSASRWARSSSESSVELSLSEELSLLLSLDEGGTTALVGGGTAGEDTATTGSSGSSGILAKRISNTSWVRRESRACQGCWVLRHVGRGWLGHGPASPQPHWLLGLTKHEANRRVKEDWANSDLLSATKVKERPSRAP